MHYCQITANVIKEAAAEMPNWGHPESTVSSPSGLNDLMQRTKVSPVHTAVK